MKVNHENAFALYCKIVSLCMFIDAMKFLFYLLIKHLEEKKVTLNMLLS